MTMTTRLALASGAVMVLTSAQPSPAATVTDQRCAKGADIRRIEIRFADDKDRLPCKVIYRPEAESDTLGIVSWQNIESLAACEAQSNAVIERLALEGWTCAEDSREDEPYAGDGAERIEQQAGQSARLEDIAVDDSAAFDGAASPLETPLALGEDPETIVGEEDVPARLVDNPDIAPPSDDLTALVKADLEQLDTTLDGLLEAKIAGYGDLNADDVDDALVLYTYTSPQPAYRQFLAVYMFDDGAYQLTATKPVSGSMNATKGARIEAVDQGVVHLSLQAFNPGDASCCPSGTQDLALALRELDLVEIDADTPTR